MAEKKASLLATADQSLARLVATLGEMERHRQKLTADGAAPDEWARFFLRARDYYDDLGAVNRMFSALYSIMAQEVMPEVFQRAGVSSLTIKVGEQTFRLTISGLTRASMKDKEAAFEWLRKNDHADLIIETVNASTLAALAKELLEQNVELPAECFNVHVGHNTSITKVADAKAKAKPARKAGGRG